MNNAELIKALRTCADHNAVGDKCYGECPYNGNYNECVDQMILDAADAIEAAEKRIAVLEAQNELKDGTITAMATDIGKLRAQMPKEGEWIKHGCEEDQFTYWECPFCGFIGLEYHYCPNCGARMKGENDGES